MPADIEECLQRMRDVLMLDEDFGQQCRTAEDLCRLLADGEKLCCILCVLSAGSLSPDGEGTVSFYSENSQILARRNVRFFLAKCSEHFRIQREDLFEPEDLLELRRPQRVLAGLWALLQQPYEQLTIRRKSEMITVAPEGAAGGVVQNVVKEICQSERQLANKLDLLLRFRHELRGLLSEWSEDLIENTFRYVEELLRVHENFYGELSRLAEEGPAKFCSGLATLFGGVKPQLTIYAKYYSHFPLAKARLEEEFKAEPQLKKQLGMLEEHFQVNSFNVLFDSPLRQVFNYSLLFDRLLDTATAELPDTANSVETALNECKRLLIQLNECKRSAEKAAVTQQLLQTVAGLPSELARLEEVGLHRADGQFRVRRDQEAERDCFCLLTDQQVIVAKAKRMEYLFSVPIAEDLELDYAQKEIGSGNASKYGTLTYSNANAQVGRVFTLRHASVGTVAFNKALDSKKSKDVCQWGQLVTKAVAVNFPLGWNQNGHRFRLQTFPSGSACTRCRETLNGHVLQGYFCEHCRMQLDLRCLQTLAPPPRPFSFPGASQGRDSGDCEFLHRDPLDRVSAQRMLMRAKSPRAFLIRENAEKATLVLSIKWDGDRIFHLIIYEKEEESLGSTQYSVDIVGNVWHSSLDRLVAYYRTNKLKIGGITGVTLEEGIPSQSASVYMNVN